MIDERHSAECDPWKKNRLLLVKLAARGERTAAKIQAWHEEKYDIKQPSQTVLGWLRKVLLVP